MNDRFYIEDEQVKDRTGLMQPVWFDRLGDAVKHCEFLNKWIKE